MTKAQPDVARFCALNAKAMTEFLDNYCPELQFLIVIREDSNNLSMHQIDIVNSSHDPHDIFCCCKHCFEARSLHHSPASTIF